MEFKGAEACVLFGSGYLANSGVISALAREGSVVFSDALNHASIVDGCRLARAETFVYDHCDPDHLEWGLRQADGRGSLIVTDSVFSMDGDIAPLEEIVELAQRYDARVMVDEAHATGCVGPGGRGAVADAGLEDEVDIVVGTLGKALGSYGAYVCCERTMAEYLVNRARTLIFSTALPPPAVAAAMASLEILREQPERVDKLHRNSRELRAALAARGVDAGHSETQIVPLVVGDAGEAMEACERALAGGVFAQAIRPPTVPEGTSRLRLAVMASHTRSELRRAAEVLASALGARRRRPRAGGRPRGRSPPSTTAWPRRPEPPAAVGGEAGPALRCLSSRRARPLRHRDRHRRRQDRRGRGDLRRAGGARRAGGRVQAGRHGARRAGRRVAARPRAAGRGGERGAVARGRRAAHVRAAGLAAPRGRAGGHDPGAARAGRRRAPPARAPTR